MTPSEFANLYKIKGASFHSNGLFRKWTSVPDVGRKLTNPKSRIHLGCPNRDLLEFVVMILPFTTCDFAYGLSHFQWSAEDGYAFFLYPKNDDGYLEFGELCRANDIPNLPTEMEKRNSRQFWFMGNESSSDGGEGRESDYNRDNDRARNCYENQ